MCEQFHKDNIIATLNAMQQEALSFDTKDVQDRLHTMNIHVPYKELYKEIFQYFAHGNFQVEYVAQPVEIATKEGTKATTLMYRPISSFRQKKVQPAKDETVQQN